MIVGALIGVLIYIILPIVLGAMMPEGTDLTVCSP
jgi:hypothetical protein